ncbi:MAG: hypothetical protein ACK46X_02510 [Candidatus Sericytochromatia bacterium]
MTAGRLAAWKRPARRALGAMAGAAVGMALFILTETARSKGPPFSEQLDDLLFLSAVVVGPILVAGLLTLLVTRRWPGIRSGWLATLVTVAGLYSGALIAMASASWTMNDFDPLKVLLIGTVAALFGFIFVGPWSLVAGWVTFYVMDRAATKEPTPAPHPQESEKP